MMFKFTDQFQAAPSARRINRLSIDICLDKLMNQ